MGIIEVVQNAETVAKVMLLLGTTKCFDRSIYNRSNYIMAGVFQPSKMSLCMIG